MRSILILSGLLPVLLSAQNVGINATGGDPDGMIARATIAEEGHLTPHCAHLAAYAGG